MDVQTPGAELLLKNRLRAVLLGLVVLVIVAEIVVLSPASIEQPDAVAPVDPEDIAEQIGDTNPVTLAPGIPKSHIPEYSVEQFNYVSTQGGQKQWNLVAERAYLYNKDKLVHARNVTAYLFDPEGKVTVVKGKEAKYFMNKRDLEIFGDVHSEFPDGFKTESEYMQYLPNSRKIVMPITEFVKGYGHESMSQDYYFESFGMDYSMGQAEIVLLKDVKLVLTKKGSEAGPSAGVPDTTTIESDHCVIHRDTQIANFTMYPKRPLETRFVRINQPTMFARGRRADLSYGDFSNVLNYMVAYQDVLIKEKGKSDALRWGTGGKAEFNTRRNVVVLTEYPQVYQNNDTVTGDIIIVHRDTDVVEVENSNAFSEGQQPENQP